jgi:hypothetical protein
VTLAMHPLDIPLFALVGLLGIVPLSTQVHVPLLLPHVSPPLLFLFCFVCF